MTKLDRRIVRTRDSLREALIALIQEKGYDQLSVQDITERANVNRATFYLHYRDKEDLLLTSMQEVYNDLLATMAEKSAEMQTWDDEIYLVTLRHVVEYADFYRVMLSAKGVAAFTVYIMDYIAQATEKLMTIGMPDLAQKQLPHDFIAYYSAGALIGVMRWWLLNDMPMGVEALARWCCRLDNYIADGLVREEEGLR